MKIILIWFNYSSLFDFNNKIREWYIILEVGIYIEKEIKEEIYILKILNLEYNLCYFVDYGVLYSYYLFFLLLIIYFWFFMFFEIIIFKYMKYFLTEMMILIRRKLFFFEKIKNIYDFCYYFCYISYKWWKMNVFYFKII